MSNTKGIGDLIVASSISNLIESIHIDQIDHRIYDKMKELNYDIYGVEDEDYLVGYIEQSDIEGNVKSLEISRIISGDTPMQTVYGKLLQYEFLFVLNKDRIKEIITLADLTKFPSRAFVFTTISQFEMQMAESLKAKNKFADLEEYLSEERLNKARTLFNEKVSNHLDIDIFECLELSDKATLFFKINGYKGFGFKNKREKKSFVKKLIDIRNSISHGNDFFKIHGPEDTIKNVIKVIDILKALEASY